MKIWMKNHPGQKITQNIDFYLELAYYVQEQRWIMFRVAFYMQPLHKAYITKAHFKTVKPTSARASFDKL